MARWQSCNILQVGPETRQIWQFDARKDGFVLSSEKSAPVGQPLPGNVGARTWRSLLQKTLNVALLPPEQVFLRAIQLPQAGFDETLAMVELQLEKLSPLPVAQIVWTIHPLPQIVENQQTVIVIMAARSQVEAFLGQLESQGYLADRLELALLDRLSPTSADRDGAWLYPDTVGGRDAALIAWWCHGALRHLGLISAPPGPKRGETLCAQLSQMAWAGELEGWLQGVPKLHLVASPETAAEWEPLLREGLKEFPEIVPPVPPAEVATATARRAAQMPPKANLLPPEYSARYQQQFVDRLWMRGLGAVLGVYVVGVLIYLAALQVQLYRVSGVEQQVAELGPLYTNTLQIRDRYLVLQDRRDLRYAALDSWKAVAEKLPTGATLDRMDLSAGKKFRIQGTAPSEMVSDLNNFTHQLSSMEVNGRPLFVKEGSFNNSVADPQGKTTGWSFATELSRAEGP